MNNSTLQVYSQAGTAHSSGVLSGNDNIPNPHLSGLAAFKQKNQKKENEEDVSIRAAYQPILKPRVSLKK